MNKTQMMNEIMRVYDENEDLKRQLQQAKEGKVPLENAENRNAQMDDNIISIGRKMAYASIFYKGWNLPSVKVRDDQNKMNFITFDQWEKSIDTSVINSSYQYLLNTMTLNSIKDYFKAELKESYDKLVADADGGVCRYALEGELMTANEAEEAKKAFYDTSCEAVRYALDKGYSKFVVEKSEQK